MDQADFAGAGGVDAFGRLEVAAGLAGADGAQHVGRNRRRDDAELDFGGGENGFGRGDGDVAGGSEAHAATERGALDTGDGRFLHLGQRAQHSGQGAGVVQVVVEAVVGGALHPVEVGAGREAFSSSGEDDDADVVVFVEGDAGGGEFGDQDFVEGVVEVGAVHPDRGDRAGEFDLQCLEGHGLSPRIFYLLVWGMLDF
jgi:hypothetical protein